MTLNNPRLLSLIILAGLIALIALACDEDRVGPRVENTQTEAPEPSLTQMNAPTEISTADGSPIRTYTPEKWFQYPLSVGNRWEYSGQLLLYNFRPDTLAELFEDTLLYRTSVVEVVSLDTLPGDKPAYRLHEIMTENASTWESDTWFCNHKTGFFYYGHSGPSSVAPLKVDQPHAFELNGHRFNSIREISAFLTRDLEPAGLLTRDAIFHDPPLKSLQFPLEVGSWWTFRQPGDPWRIDKTVLAKDSITVEAGTFEGLMIRWMYDLDADGEWDTDVYIDDFVSRDGLVKRTINVFDVMCAGMQDPTPLGLLDYKEEYELTDVVWPSGSGMTMLR